jgi:hypothetical protein
MRLSKKNLLEKETQIKYGFVILSEAKELTFRPQIVIKKRDGSLRSP